MVQESGGAKASLPGPCGGEKEGDRLFQQLTSISRCGQVRTRLVASTGKITAVLFLLLWETVLRAQQPAPCKLSCAFPGGPQFFGTSVIFLCMKWLVGSWYESCLLQDSHRTCPSSRKDLKFRKNFRKKFRK